MTGALLYQPKQSWRMGLAFVAAALIHFAAVAIADLQRSTPIEMTVSGDEGPSVDLIPPDVPLEQPTPPLEDDAPPTPAPISVDESLFVEDRATRPPIRPQISKPFLPIVKTRSGLTSGAVSFSSVRAMALSGPRPVYPYEARRQRITGSGIAMMRVDPETGNVNDVAMQQSTGSPVLDNAAVTAFRRWRFKAGTGPRVRAPITFTLTGAQY